MINILSLRIELKASNNMETITKIPGLQHIAEDILKLLDKKSLMDCRLVNSSWKNVFDQPIFWIKKLNEIKLHKGDKIDEMDTDSISEIIFLILLMMMMP